jgi:hypothetical protein
MNKGDSPIGEDKDWSQFSLAAALHGMEDEGFSSYNSTPVQGSLDNLFIGVYPTGIVYADKRVEDHGNYKKVAFLSYRTLELEISVPDSDLLDAIVEDAKTIQARKGEHFQVSTSGQTVILGQ